MSVTESASPRLGNSELDTGYDRPPLSTIAVIALVVGLASLIVPTTFALLPLSFLAIAVGSAAVWQVVRDPGVRGAWLAKFGLGLGVATCTWSLTAYSASTSYLYDVAGENAKIYLKLFSDGQIFEALELRYPINERQIAGTDLEAYYRQRAGEPADRTREILASDSTRLAMDAGPNADWQIVKGIKIEADGSQKRVTVRMVNAANNGGLIDVTLRHITLQDESGSQSTWMVMDTRIAKDENGRPVQI